MLKNKIPGILLAILLAPTPSHTAPDANQILARAKQAAGGDAWNALRTSHTELKITTGGLGGTAESWADLQTGHSLDRYQLGPSSGAQGFDGTVVWSEDSSKQPRREEGDEAREAAVDEAYRQCLAYWFPERWPAAVEYSGKKEEAERSFHVLRITPRGGRPFDLWVDAATYLFDRTVEKAAIETRTVYFSDYRTVAGVKVPFAAHSTNGETRYDLFITIEKIEFNGPLEQARFRMPPPPPPDFVLAGGGTSTTVPFQLLNNHIYLEVKLNGKGPFRLLCDTGGANIVTPELAADLGLKSEGKLQGRGVGEKSEDVALAKIHSLEIGAATISSQVFAVFPLQSFATVEGVPVLGLVGYEVFKRFVVKVDYEHSLLTLTLPSAFAYQGSGTIVPFTFKGHIPEVEGEIDGIPGKFDIDTGARGSLSLLGPFAEQHQLKARYTPAFEAVTGWGVGGAARALVARAKTLRLGTVQMENPVTFLSLQKGGAFVDRYVAGNVGGALLSRFNITFDYTRQQLIFERNANDATPDTFDRSGMWLNQAAGSFEVIDVIAGGPAAQAGIRVGDRILAMDGQSTGQLLLPAVRSKFKHGPPGTQVLLTVQSGNSKREVTLTLKDLV